MGIFSNRIAFLTESGLAKVCGMSPDAISKEADALVCPASEIIAGAVAIPHRCANVLDRSYQLPSNHLCQAVPSWPTMNRSIRPVLQLTAAGDEKRVFPSSSQLCHGPLSIQR